MILQCPNCRAGFMVDPLAIGSTGRRVRCGSCGHVWRAEPPPPETLAAAISQAPPAATEPESTPTAAETPRSDANLPAVVQGRSPAIAIGWAVLVLLLAGLVVGAVIGRDAIIARFPQTEALYLRLELVEIPPFTLEIPQDRLSFEMRSDELGVPLLAVRGVVRNAGEASQDVPPLIAAVTDGQRALKEWRFTVGAARLEAGEEVSFEETFRNPPREGTALSIVFASEPPPDE